MKTTPNPGLRQTYVNLKKANWDRYRLELEAALSKCSLPTDCQRDEKILRTILLKAASHHIPTGRHRLHEEPVPAEILDVMTRRDDLRKRDRTSPELPRLNKDIQKHICEHKRQKLRDFVENMDHKTDITKLWRMMKETLFTTRAESVRMLVSTSAPTAARHHTMLSISSIAQLIQRQWHRRTYGTDQWTQSGTSAISREY